jgi:dCMP deaminase
MIKSDIMYIHEAYKEAIDHSTDPSTQNGAILVNTAGEIVARGANHFPRNVKESPERWQRPLKYQFVEHAERNVIFDAAVHGISTDGLTMYCPWFACADCARAIIQSKISKVVGHDCPLHKTRPDWQQSIQVALDMFKEAGVETRWITGDVGDILIRFDSKIVKP